MREVEWGAVLQGHHFVFAVAHGIEIGLLIASVILLYAIYQKVDHK